jgi:hypothetical protein
MDAQPVRLIVASFLTRDLYLDWRAGAEHFFDLGYSNRRQRPSRVLATVSGSISSHD